MLPGWISNRVLVVYRIWYPEILQLGMRRESYLRSYPIRTSAGWQEQHGATLTHQSKRRQPKTLWNVHYWHLL